MAWIPDRASTDRRGLRSGIHIMFLGGWLSFNGEMGKGCWGAIQSTRLQRAEPEQDNAGAWRFISLLCVLWATANRHAWHELTLTSVKWPDRFTVRPCKQRSKKN